MCSSYTVCTDDDNSLMTLFLQRAGLSDDQGDVYPKLAAPIIHTIGDKICSRPALWGIVGYNKKVIFNARVETVTQKELFARDFENHRCVIPATAFYEWNHKLGPDGKKDRYKFTLPYDDIIYMCGFYTLREGVKYFVILTTEASPDVDDIHTRMPVIILQNRVRTYLTDPHQCYDIACTMPPVLKRAVI